jgi:hypothetical protein
MKTKTEKKTKNCCSKRPTLLKGHMGDSSRSLGISRSLRNLSISRDGSSRNLNASSSSLDASSSSLDVSSSSWKHTQDHYISPVQLPRITVEQSRQREERRCKREAAKKNSVPEVDVQYKIMAPNDRPVNIKDNRRQRAFVWYAHMNSPTRTEFKRKVEASASSIDILPEDVDLLPWNLTGKVVNVPKMNAIIRASILMK